jgi:hypothetical protein
MWGRRLDRGRHLRSPAVHGPHGHRVKPNDHSNHQHDKHHEHDLYRDRGIVERLGLERLRERRRQLRLDLRRRQRVELRRDLWKLRRDLGRRRRDLGKRRLELQLDERRRRPQPGVLPAEPRRLLGGTRPLPGASAPAPPSVDGG